MWNLNANEVTKKKFSTAVKTQLLEQQDLKTELQVWRQALKDRWGKYGDAMQNQMITGHQQSSKILLKFSTKIWYSTQCTWSNFICAQGINNREEIALKQVSYSP